MFRVGLTGGIGSGKSLMCSILEKLRVPVYYADGEAKRLMDCDPVLKAQILDLFGEKALAWEALTGNIWQGECLGMANCLKP